MSSTQLKLNDDQTAALGAIKSFLKTGNQVFILKGPAGTGKTTLVHAVCKYLKDTNKTFKLTATTGRAAKVLSSKTKQNAFTLHSTLYMFDEVTGSDTSGADPWESKTGQLFLNFGLRTSSEPDQHPKVIIVDEASMISHLTQATFDTAVFGSGNLLDDLLKFAGQSKIIFVGDSCQLPPVAEESMSAALSQTYWTQRGITAQTFELTQIIRQEAGNEILEVAGVYRNNILHPAGSQLLSFPLPEGRHVFATLGREEFLNEYITLCKEHGITAAVAICHSNNQAYDLNRYIRSQLHGRPELQPGEMLMVIQNSYSVALVNGDQVQVEKVSYDCNRAGFTFMNVQVKSLFNDMVYDTKIIGNLLYNSSPALSADETKALLIDFDGRMRNRGIHRNSPKYKEEMRRDPYLNALRAKFGYAITVHKAQGGEWKTVFLYLNSSIYAMVYDNADGADKFHRWFYTAVTRARERLVVNDCPFVERFAHRFPEENHQYWNEIRKRKNVSRSI